MKTKKQAKAEFIEHEIDYMGLVKEASHILQDDLDTTPPRNEFIDWIPRCLKNKEIWDLPIATYRYSLRMPKNKKPQIEEAIITQRS